VWDLQINICVVWVTNEYTCTAQAQVSVSIKSYSAAGSEAWSKEGIGSPVTSESW
jgi:hypothetical protein